MVFSGAVQGGHGWIVAVFLAGAFLTILYLFRLFNAIFLSSPRMVPAGEGSRLMVACVALLAGLSLACGLWIAPSSQLAQAAVRQMLGATP
jgi:NADH-quinone oxidoreductase subunit L